jgi:fumarate reductase subunit C
MLRELSSVFIALFLVVYLCQIYELSQGPDAYSAFTQKLSSPGWILFHFVVLLFALYHSITWFQSSAVVLPLRIGERSVSRTIVFALHVAAWLMVSVIVLVLFLELKS